MFKKNPKVGLIVILLYFITFLSCKSGNEDSGNYQGGDSSLNISEIRAEMQKRPYSPDVLKRYWEYCSIKGNYDSIIISAADAYRIAESVANDTLKMVSGIYLGNAYIFREELDSMFVYYKAILPITERLGIDFYSSVVYNGLGLHALNYLNYNEALDCFQKTTNLLLKIGYDREYHVLLSNIVLTYYMRQDPTGYKYAMEIYEKGVEDDDKYFITLGAINVAYMLFLSGDYDKAADYIDKAVVLYESGVKVMCPYVMKANVEYARGNLSLAEQYYEKAGENLDRMDTMRKIEYLLYHGIFLQETGRKSDAAEHYLQGIDISEKSRNNFFIIRLCKLLSDTYADLGRENLALEYMRKYHDLNENVFNVEKERMFNNLKLDYEMEQKDSYISKQELQILKAETRSYIMFGVIVFAFIAIASVIFFYNLKNRRYRDLVVKYENHRQNEKLLQSRIDELQTILSLGNISAKTQVGDVSAQKLVELYERLENLMKSEKLYRNKDISVKLLADILETNTNYVSKMFSKAGTSYSQYINGYRIREAVEVLSNPDRDVPIKYLSDMLGYSSMSSFYRLFQNETGVTPSRYRQEILKIRKSQPSA